MIILRSKNFADINNTATPTATPQSQPNQPTSKDLQMEQFRLQRQMMLTQRMREQIRAQESRDKFKAIQKAQTIDQKQDEQQKKNQINVAKLNSNDGTAKNVNLFKTRAQSVSPVAMK